MGAHPPPATPAAAGRMSAQRATAALCSLVLLLGSGVSPSPASPEPRPSNYEERFRRPRQGVFLKDTNVWVYTSAFAKRFGMPTEWIDDSLRGAEAVAYRVEWDSFQECGFFGEPNNCRPIESCVLDLYISDEQSKKLPWKNNHPQGFVSFTSAHFLVPQDLTTHRVGIAKKAGRTYTAAAPASTRSTG